MSWRLIFFASVDKFRCKCDRHEKFQCDKKVKSFCFLKSTAFSDQKRSSLTKDHAWWFKITREHIKTDVSEKNCFTCGQDGDLVFFCQLKEKSELAFFRCLCTCSVNVQTWKLIFMFAFVSTLFSNTTNVIEIFLHSCDNLTLKVLYDVLGLGQTPWWWLCWRSACRISCISAYHSSIQILLWPWDVHDRHP